MWKELAGQMTYPKYYYQLEEQNSSKKSQNSMKFYRSLEILPNMQQNKFHFDMWKETEIINRKPRTDGRTDGY
jgi:hypothetical protein